MGIPVATCRLQLTPDSGFAHARAAAAYLRDLGISDVYTSPIFEARAGSTHGYDTTDPTRIRAELGGDPGFHALSDELRRLGMGLVVDIVPNHAAADPSNPWWRDVLRRGSASPYAGHFDIDWSLVEGKVVLPMLGADLEEVIRGGELQLEAAGAGEPELVYHEHRLPVAPGSARAGDSVADVAARQNYRLEYWKTGADRVNYRRFFDIADLVALRAEDETVFGATHGAILRLVAEGRVTGLRVDHIDGLRDPRGYLERLARGVASARPDGAYLVVEKILVRDERLPGDWPVHGSTGYDFLNQCNLLFIDPQGWKPLRDHAASLGVGADFDAAVYNAKKEVIATLFSPDLARLAAMLAGIAESRNVGHTREGLRDAVTEATAALPVYRTYLPDEGTRERDRALIAGAAGAALARGADAGAVGLLRDVLLGPLESPEDRDFAARWQQFTGPVMAKGAEDTALYRCTFLTSLNEVGGGAWAASLAEEAVRAFHESNLRRARHFPHTLNTTSTHDTKRGEDTRLRISILSELAPDWLAALGRWRAWHAPLRTRLPAGEAPDAADELLIYQSILGIWPAGDDDPAPIADRLAAYMIKAAREAKRRTSWRDPDDAYEGAATSFVQTLLAGERGARFRADAQPLRRAAAFSGAIHSLSQVVLKAFSPGVPDFYQGSEWWDLALVDPDNRRPVDFAARARALSEIRAREARHRPALVAELLAAWPDARVKAYTTARALALRAAAVDLLSVGGYLPLKVRGDFSDHLVAFARHAGDRWLVVVAPRLVARLTPPGEWPLGGVWRETGLELPPGSPASFREWFTDTPVQNHGGLLPARDIFSTFPVAALVG